MYKNILLPIALDHRPTADIAMGVAKALADPGATIHALTVVEAIPPYATIEIPPEIMEQGRETALRELSETVAGIEGAEAHVVVGRPGQAIVDYADKHGIDCIVIASHQPGLQDYFLGSTAARVVRHAHCAVHVVR